MDIMNIIHKYFKQLLKHTRVAKKIANRKTNKNSLRA